MTQYIRNEVVLAKVETTYGTDAVPDGTDAVQVRVSPEWAYEGLRMVDRNLVKPSLATDQSIYAGTLKQITFTAELRGSGAAGTPPMIGSLLRACGLGETISAGVSVEYAPVAANLTESVTIYYNQDGVLHKLLGARGNAQFALSAGEVGLVTFTLLGLDQPVLDVALPTPTYDSTLPNPIVGVPFTFGGYAAVISALSCDLGNQFPPRPAVGGADGYASVEITGRDVMGNFDADMTLIATKDWIGELKAGTTGVLTSGSVGATAGNIYRFLMSTAYIRNLSPGDQGGVRKINVDYGAAESAAGANDEISLLFT